MPSHFLLINNFEITLAILILLRFYTPFGSVKLVFSSVVITASAEISSFSCFMTRKLGG